MLIERHFSNPINVKDLTIEAPQKEPELPFDPERDITQEDWEKMKDFVQGGIYRYEAAGYLALLFPERKNDSLKRYLRPISLLRSYEDMLQRGNYDGMIVLARAIKSLDPEDIAVLDLDNPAWNEVKETIKEEYYGGLVNFYADQIWLKFVFPRFSFEQDIGREDLLQNAKNWQETFRNSQDWYNFTTICASIKMTLGVSLPITAKDWKGMKEFFSLCDPETELFIEFPLYMKILAAKEVTVTDMGMEIVKQEGSPDFEAGVPPLPEIKRIGN